MDDLYVGAVDDQVFIADLETERQCFGTIGRSVAPIFRLEIQQLENPTQKDSHHAALVIKLTSQRVGLLPELQRLCGKVRLIESHNVIGLGQPKQRCELLCGVAGLPGARKQPIVGAGGFFATEEPQE